MVSRNQIISQKTYENIQSKIILFAFTNHTQQYKNKLKLI